MFAREDQIRANNSWRMFLQQGTGPGTMQAVSPSITTETGNSHNRYISKRKGQSQPPSQVIYNLFYICLSCCNTKGEQMRNNFSKCNHFYSGLTEQARPECSTLESWAKTMLAAATELKETEVYEAGWSMETRIIKQCLGQAYVSPGWYIGLERTPLFPKVILCV